MTMTLIETKTLGTAAASIEFTSIPQTFTDLVILVSARSSASSDFYRIRPNGSTTDGSARQLFGTNEAASSGTSISAFGRMSISTYTSNTFGNDSWYIPNYTGNNSKSISVDAVNENNSSTLYTMSIVAGLWANSAAITSFQFYPGADNFAAGSTFSLYGILKGSSGGVTVS